MTDPRPPFPLVDWPEVKSRNYHSELKAERDTLWLQLEKERNWTTQYLNERDALREALKVARKAMLASRRATIMMSPNPDGVLGMQALHAVKLIDAALAQIDKIIGGGNE